MLIVYLSLELWCVHILGRAGPALLEYCHDKKRRSHHQELDSLYHLQPSIFCDTTQHILMRKYVFLAFTPHWIAEQFMQTHKEGIICCVLCVPSKTKGAKCYAYHQILRGLGNIPAHLHKSEWTRVAVPCFKMGHYGWNTGATRLKYKNMKENHIFLPI